MKKIPNLKEKNIYLIQQINLRLKVKHEYISRTQKQNQIYKKYIYIVVRWVSILFLL